jgi:MraZ protein
MIKGAWQCQPDFAIFSPRAWLLRVALIAQKVSGLSFGQSGARDIQRRLFSAATDLPVDKQGRILIPQTLREYAELGESVMVTGMNEYFEIWSTERWKAVIEKLDSDPQTFAQQLFDLGI